MNYEIILHTLTFLIFSIVILWFSAFNMLKKENIILLLPFALIGFLFCFQAGVVFFEFFFIIGSLEITSWFFYESLLLLLLLWIFINIRRVNYGD